MQDIIVSMGGMSMELLDLDSTKCDLDLRLPSPISKHCTSDVKGEDIVSQMSSALNEALQLKNTEVGSNIDSPLGANGDGDMAVTVTSEKSRAWEDDNSPLNVPVSTSVKCLCKSATFPVMDSRSAAPADSKDRAHASDLQENVSCLRSMSLPVPRKLIPALKGSREKEGLPLRKLSVSWAPDVYDPPPSSVSHLPKKKNNQQYKNSKKYGKGKHRGKNSRGSGKKDKKHNREELSLGRKYTMDPTAVVDTEKKFTVDPIVLEDAEKILSSNYKSSVELLGFDNDVDSPDSNCGSSFLRKSRSTLHFPYAETT